MEIDNIMAKNIETNPTIELIKGLNPEDRAKALEVLQEKSELSNRELADLLVKQNQALIDSMSSSTAKPLDFEKAMEAFAGMTKGMATDMNKELASAIVEGLKPVIEGKKSEGIWNSFKKCYTTSWEEGTFTQNTVKVVTAALAAYGTYEVAGMVYDSYFGEDISSDDRAAGLRAVNE